MKTLLLSKEEAKAEGVITLETVISSISFGRFHALLMFACGAGWTIDNMWAMELSFLLPAIQREFGLTPSVAAILLAIEHFGLLIGALVWGRASDSYGRKYIFLVTLILSGLFGTALAFSFDFGAMIGLTFGLCVGVGGNIPIDGAMFAEFTSRFHRGHLMALMTLFWVLGGMAGAGLCWGFITYFSCPPTGRCDTYDNLGWRYVIFITGILNLLLIFLRWGIPESPRYLASRGREEEVKAVLKKIVRDNKSDVVVPENIVIVPNSYLGITDGFKKMFSPKYFRTSLCLVFIWFFAGLGASCFQNFLPALFSQKGSLTTTEVYRNTFIYQAVGIPASIFTAWIIHTRVGRKWTLVISAFCCGISVLLFLFLSDKIIIVLCASLVSFFLQMYYGSVYTYTPEVYPTQIRTTAGGLLSSINRVAGTIAPLVAGLIIEHFSYQTLLSLSCASFAIVGITAFFLKKETNNLELK